MSARSKRPPDRARGAADRVRELRATSPPQRHAPASALERMPYASDPAAVLALQRAVGNRAVDRWLGSRARVTGLPSDIKRDVERASGLDLSHVRVHLDSPAPVRLQALAYTEGADIHVAPGQERHLAHEAWHVVQQAQSRVRPMFHLHGKAINDDPALEREAAGIERPGGGASGPTAVSTLRRAPGVGVVQRLSIEPPIEWEKCTNVTLSTSGARGVYFLNEGEEPNPATTLVVKPDDAPPSGVALVDELHWTVGGSRTPPTRALADAEIAKAKATVEAKTDEHEWGRLTAKPRFREWTWTDVKEAKMGEWDDLPRTFVMSMVTGRTFQDISRKATVEELEQIIQTKEFLDAVGAMTVVDIITSNTDRIDSDNTGNWLLDATGRLHVIDSYNTSTIRSHDENPRHLRDWLAKLRDDRMPATAGWIAERVIKGIAADREKLDPAATWAARVAELAEAMKAPVLAAMRRVKEGMIALVMRGEGETAFYKYLKRLDARAAEMVRSNLQRVARDDAALFETPVARQGGAPQAVVQRVPFKTAGGSRDTDEFDDKGVERLFDELVKGEDLTGVVALTHALDRDKRKGLAAKVRAELSRRVPDLRPTKKQYQPYKLDMTLEGARTDIDANTLVYSGREREAFRVIANDEGQCTNVFGRVLEFEKQRVGDPSFIWVMDDRGSLYVQCHDWHEGIFHSTLMGGHRPIGAGEINVRDGKIVMLNEESGHYKPQGRIAWVTAVLRKQGFDLSQAKVSESQHATMDQYGMPQKIRIARV